MNTFLKAIGGAIAWGMAASLMSAVAAAATLVFASMQTGSSSYGLMLLPIYALASAVIAFVPAALIAAVLIAFEKALAADAVPATKRQRAMPLLLIPIVIAAVALPPMYFR